MGWLQGLSSPPFYAADGGWKSRFFYHSMKEKSIVGIVEVIAKAHLDSTTDDPRWECVDIRAVKAVNKPVSIQQIKSHPRLE